jgi:hypothetical protein
MTEMDMKVWVHGKRKRIHGLVAENGIWRRTNQEMSYIKI